MAQIMRSPCQVLEHSILHDGAKIRGKSSWLWAPDCGWEELHFSPCFCRKRF